ncbi:O-antigen ligase family protein [Granulosicoccus sp. 3-233]|uniref:O-antigen ligase family protein n=1 Tax=Granulosicoccus sp. 3-233 TaxID=3417969 RepID=UPI003D34DD0B
MRRIRSGLIEPFLHWLRESAWICAVPLLLLLGITATDFLILTNVSDASRSLFFEELPVPYNDSRRDAAETLKADTLQYVYLLLLFLCAFRWRKIVGYLMEWPHLVLIVAYLLVGVLYSMDPVKVVTNSILIFIGFLAAILFATAYSSPGRYDGFFHVVFWPLVLLHLASLFILNLYDVDLLSFLASTQRYGGLAGNPNSLGSTAVLGVWAGASILLSAHSSRAVRVLALLGLLLLFFNTALSGSGTSTAAILLVLFALAWLRILAAFQPKIRLILNGSLILIAVFVFMYGMLFTTPAELYLSITGSMGKDATLSGRTELWAIASDAINLKPWLGWGFDSHQSVMAERTFSVRFNHYHNGFLDTVVAGGVVLLALVGYNLVRFCQVFLRTFRKDANAFPLLLPLLILLALNMSEYSLLRPNSQLWLVYMISFTMLTYSPAVSVSLQFSLGSKERKSRRFSGARSGRRKRGEKLRWG